MKWPVDRSVLFSKPEGSVYNGDIPPTWKSCRETEGTESDVLLCILLIRRAGGAFGQESPHLSSSQQPGEGAEVKGRRTAVESLLGTST